MVDGSSDCIRLQCASFLTCHSGKVAVKKYGILMMLICLYPGIAIGDTIEAGIVERIKKVGSVCIQGTSCAPGGADSAMVGDATGVGGVEENYRKTCSTCHAIGVAGAPKPGDVLAWEPRIAKGMDALYQSSINGLPPGMPAKGMCFTCSDDDLRALVDYMVESVK